MYNINIQNNEITLKTIDKDSIESLYSIYTNTEEFKYATGFFGNPPGFDQYICEVYKFLLKENTFFLEIHLPSISEPIGLLKGSVIDNEKIVWINSLAIDTSYQSKGYGKKVIALFEKYYSQNFNITRIFLSVSKNNISGINFWKKCGYRNCDSLPAQYYNKLDEHVQIMQKILKK